MIKQLPSQWLLAASFLLIPLHSWANENNLPLVPLASVVDYTNSDGWAGVVGLKFESSAAYDGSDHKILELKPEGAIQWRTGNHILFWEGFDLNQTEFGWRGLFENNWLMEAGLRHEIVLPEGRSEVAEIDNLPHRGSHALAFFEGKHAIDDNWQNWIAGRVLGGPSSYGWLAKVSAGHQFTNGQGNSGTELVVFASFASKENINNYFGVSEVDANASGLEQANLDGGYRSSGLQLIYRRNMLSNMQLSAHAGIEFYNSDFEKSDIVRDTSETNTGLAVLWMF